MFSFVGISTSLWFIVLALIFSGFGFGLFSSPNTNAVMSCVKKEDYSVAKLHLGHHADRRTHLQHGGGDHRRRLYPRQYDP